MSSMSSNSISEILQGDAIVVTYRGLPHHHWLHDAEKQICAKGIKFVLASYNEDGSFPDATKAKLDGVLADPAVNKVHWLSDRYIPQALLRLRNLENAAAKIKKEGKFWDDDEADPIYPVLEELVLEEADRKKILHTVLDRRDILEPNNLNNLPIFRLPNAYDLADYFLKFSEKSPSGLSDDYSEVLDCDSELSGKIHSANTDNMLKLFEDVVVPPKVRHYIETLDISTVPPKEYERGSREEYLEYVQEELWRLARIITRIVQQAGENPPDVIGVEISQLADHAPPSFLKQAVGLLKIVAETFGTEFQMLMRTYSAAHMASLQYQEYEAEVYANAVRQGVLEEGQTLPGTISFSRTVMEQDKTMLIVMDRHPYKYGSGGITPQSLENNITRIIAWGNRGHFGLSQPALDEQFLSLGEGVSNSIGLLILPLDDDDGFLGYRKELGRFAEGLGLWEEHELDHAGHIHSFYQAIASEFVGGGFYGLERFMKCELYSEQEFSSYRKAILMLESFDLGVGMLRKEIEGTYIPEGEELPALVKSTSFVPKIIKCLRSYDTLAAFQTELPGIYEQSRRELQAAQPGTVIEPNN